MTDLEILTLHQITKLESKTTKFGRCILCTLNNEFSVWLPRRYGELMCEETITQYNNDNRLMYMVIKEFKVYNGKHTPVLEFKYE